jgi:antitoxin VapB
LTDDEVAFYDALETNDSAVKVLGTERYVRLFKNGRSQALHIPRDLELPGREAILRKEGHRLIVEPVTRPSLLTVLRTLKPLDDDLFPRIVALPAEPVDL